MKALMMLILLGALSLAASQVSAAVRRFTLVTDALNGTTIWYPPSFTVHQGEKVVLTLINKLDEPHGFNLEDFGITEVVQPKTQTTVTVTASKTGLHNFRCHLRVIASNFAIGIKSMCCHVWAILDHSHKALIHLAL